MEDGTAAEVRILGFCHDELSDAAGKAGISFEFANVPVERWMNADWTNEGGWAKSEMRDWLNSVFFEMLPHNLRSNIAEVEKWTSCRDWDGGWGRAFHVTGTLDKLWLLSTREVYGALSVRVHNMPKYSEVYNAEGLQYQLYVNSDVSVTNYEFCRKRGAYSWWWLRSPSVDVARRFHRVDHYGGWGYDDVDSEWGVSPGFCF